MAGALRAIAVTVEERAPARFGWLLLERTDEGSKWSALERSGPSFRKYHEAMADGLLALQAMIEDLDEGPRHPEEEQEEDADAARSKQAGLFGFGGLPP